MSLLLQLRSATANLHREVERSALIAALLRGEVERPAYVALLRQLAALYEMLEARLTALADDAVIAVIHDPRLARSAALAADLQALHGEDWRQLPLAAPMQCYRQRLASASAVQLVAHAYVRYLGDLAGGQMLGRIVGDALALADENGLAFHRFPAPGVSALAAQFRNGLAALSVTLDPEAQQQLVDEAVLAFRLHGELFAALAATAEAQVSLPPS